MNDSHSRGLLRLRHLHEVTEAKGEEMDQERQRFDAMRIAGPTRAVSAFNLFQTPDHVADDMVTASGPLDGLRILEPSAGLGRLYRAIRRRSQSAEITLVEMAPQCAAELYRETQGDERARLIQADFLDCDSQRLGGMFDAVVMNPPFKMGTDLRHIDHAFELLKPGGILVSLCFAGSRQSARFGDIWNRLPAESFRSEGTRANVACVVLRKA